MSKYWIKNAQYAKRMRSINAKKTVTGKKHIFVVF